MMGKTAEMASAIQELRDIAAKANDLANWLSEIFINQKADAEEAATVREPPPALTLEEVRGRLAEIDRAVGTDQVRALIHKFGGKKLSDLDPTCYAALMKEAELLRRERRI